MKITAKERKIVNDRLYDINARRHPHIPLKDIGDVLAVVGLRIEDAIYCGREGRASNELYKGEEQVENSLLILSWYKGESNTYEITSYLS